MVLSGQKFHGAAVEYESPKWQQGDVIGLACDLEKGEILVSVNGNFSPAVFQMDPSEIPDEMHAAFSAQVRLHLRRHGDSCYSQRRC